MPYLPTSTPIVADELRKPHKRLPVTHTTDEVRPRGAAQTESTSTNKQVLGVRIAGSGSCVPAHVVRNADLEHVGCDSDWISRRTGILERRHVNGCETTSDLACEAAKRCLESAGVPPRDVDLVLVATVTPDFRAPSTAALVQGRLGCPAPAMDVSAACSGFVYGLITAAQFVKNNASKNALVIGAESLSRTANIADVQTYPLFGDGAGAVLLSRAEGDQAQDCGILGYELGAAGDQGHLITLPGIDSRPPFDHDPKYVSMDGRAVFKWAVQKIPALVAQVLHAAELTLDDIDLVVFHQANRRIIEAAADALVLPTDKVFLNVERYGNTSAASIPLALDEARRQGRIAADSRVLLCGFGAGLTWGATIFQGISAVAARSN